MQQKITNSKCDKHEKYCTVSGTVRQAGPRLTLLHVASRNDSVIQSTNYSHYDYENIQIKS